MKLSALLVVVMTGTAACGGTSVVAPTSSTRAPAPAPPNPPAPPPEMIGRYVATLAASASCASALPPTARERTYTAMLLSDGRIDWTGPALTPGHRPMSWGTLVDGVFSFSIDNDRDPQSDDFHGLWDAIGGDTILNISGKGRGIVDGGEITGVLDGFFAFYGPAFNPTLEMVGSYCRATDHRFTFVRQ